MHTGRVHVIGGGIKVASGCLRPRNATRGPATLLKPCLPSHGLHCNRHSQQCAWVPATLSCMALDPPAWGQGIALSDDLAVILSVVLLAGPTHSVCSGAWVHGIRSRTEQRMAHRASPGTVVHRALRGASGGGRGGRWAERWWRFAIRTSPLCAPRLCRPQRGGREVLTGRVRLGLRDPPPAACPSHRERRSSGGAGGHSRTHLVVLCGGGRLALLEHEARPWGGHRGYPLSSSCGHV